MKKIVRIKHFKDKNIDIMPYCSSDEGNKGYCWELDAPLDTNLGPLVMQSSLHIHIVYYYSLNFCLSLYSLVTVSCICSLNLW